MSYLYAFLSKFKYFLVVFAVGMLAWLITYRWSAYFDPAWPWIAGAVVVTILAVLVYEILRRRHEKKMAAGLEMGIAEAEGDKIDLKGEIKALRENWSASVDKLRSAHAGSGRTALYRLPWYMIIGEPASGKSTLLRKSGLDFPIGDAAVRGLHGTRNCDWWFANEAVFLDTAGRYIIETQEEEWVAFLTLLRKYRKKKPISGVLVAVAANSLLTKNHDELLQDGRRIRNRVDELIDILGVNFPIFVLVTKVDLVSGFVEYFGPLEPRHRDQMLGWTLPVSPDTRFDGEAFQTRFGRTTEQLFRMRPWLESRADRRDLGKAFLFPEEFSYLGDPLRTVLEVVFKANVYQETPVCRGVYFSSGTQIGNPLARALEDMARDLHIPAEFGLGLGMEEEKELRTYFIKDLVSDQILRDRDMTWRTGRAETRAKKRRMGWGMMGIGFAALLGLFATSAFLENRSDLSAFEEEYLPESGRPLEVAMGTLEAIRGAQPAGFTDLGLNYSDNMIPKIQGHFRRVVHRGLLDPSLVSIRDRLNKAVLPGEKGVPDISSYLDTWSHYLYLKKAVQGGLDKEFDVETEGADLTALYEILSGPPDEVGKADQAALRTALFEFGTDDGFAKLKEAEQGELTRRMKEAEDAFAIGAGQWLGAVESYIRNNTEAGQKIEIRFEAGIEGLIAACRDARIRPHQNLSDLKETADLMKTKGEGLDSAAEGRTPITTLAPTKAALVEYLERLRDLAPTEGDIRTRAEKALEPFQGGKVTSAVEPRHQALLDLLDEIDVVMKKGPDDPDYPERLDEDDLKRRQGLIVEELNKLETTTWERIAPEVAKLWNKPLTKTVEKDGQKLEEHVPEWYDAIPLLARARRADQRKGKYVSDGLAPWLEGDGWMRESRRDDDAEVYAVDQFVRVALSRLMEQSRFLEIPDDGEVPPLLARDTALDAQVLLSGAVKAWVKAADAYWTDRFQDGLRLFPPAQNLQQVRSELTELSGAGKSRLMDTVKEIGEALAGVERLDLDEDAEEILADSEELRTELFRRWSVCIPSKDGSHTSIHGTVDLIANFSQAILAIVPPFGTPNRTQAREFVKASLGGGSSPLTVVADAENRLREQAMDGTPRAELANRIRAIMIATWQGMLENTVEDVNRAWQDTRSRMSTISSLDDFKVAIAPGGIFANFKRDYLKDLFVGDALRPREALFPGSPRILLEPKFEASMRSVSDIRSNLFGGSSAPVDPDMLYLVPSIEGSGVESFKIEYVPKTGDPWIREYFNQEIKRPWELRWSPSQCQAFRITVKFIDGGEKLVLGPPGGWAVRDAFRAAREQADGTFVWPGTPGAWKDPAGESYEIRLKVESRSTRRLIDYAPGGTGATMGGDPVKSVIRSLPQEAVRLE